ncbi:hypothetical protein AYX07_04390 [Thermoactinomyces sp. AS95]|jgi:hypothetical protein|uniref:hypothetical protein n=1 Tax=Thermoactinomyces sp. AS95 TaxID=1811386 RepID=UPI0007A093F9|nr:hypothetical protein [Thermoactinomyces sp. AS95]KYQ87916.1 hypothetical protein AYX07_04390 [Thermoactinomyces sp. AS95]
MIAKKISVILVFSLGFLFTFFLMFSTPALVMNHPPAKINGILDNSRLDPPHPDRLTLAEQPETEMAHRCPVRLSRLILCFLSHGQ